MLEHILRKLLADQRLSRLIVVEQEMWTQALLEIHQEESRVNGESIASRARQSLTLGMSTLTSNYSKVKGLDVTLDNLASLENKPWWMIRCSCVIYEWSVLRLEPLVSWGQWKWLKSNTKRREYTQVQMHSNWTRIYIANNTNTKIRHCGSNIRNLSQNSEAVEVKSLEPARAHPGGWYKKINSERYLFCIW